MKTLPKNFSRGFTLIELLVAMAITTLIITILVSVTSMALDTWNRSRSEVRAARQAKAMIDTMANDLESFVVRKGNTFEWLYAEAQPTSSGPNGSVSPNAIDLIFFSAVTDRYEGNIGTKFPDNKGDVSTIGYKLTYTDPIDDTNVDDYKTFVLYRKLVNPDDTFEKLLGKTDLKAPFETTGDKVDKKENFICENVYQFTLIFHVDVTKTTEGPNPTTTTVSVAVPVGVDSPLANLFKINGSGIQTAFVPNQCTNAELKAGHLTSIEISTTVITDFGLKQLKKRNISDPALKGEFIAKNSYQYSKLVRVPGF